MWRPLMLLAALASLLCGAGQKRKAPSPPEVEVVEVKAHRLKRLISVDGRVSNGSPRPIQKLTLVFHFRTTDGQVLTTQRGTIQEEILEPGEESEFYWQMRDHVRAVEFTVEAVDGSGRDLTVDKAGPYPVE